MLGTSVWDNFLVSSGSTMLPGKFGNWIDKAIKVIENAKRASLKEMTYSTLISFKSIVQHASISYNIESILGIIVLTLVVLMEYA